MSDTQPGAVEADKPKRTRAPKQAPTITAPDAAGIMAMLCGDDIKTKGDPLQGWTGSPRFHLTQE